MDKEKLDPTFAELVIEAFLETVRENFPTTQSKEALLNWFSKELPTFTFGVFKSFLLSTGEVILTLIPFGILATIAAVILKFCGFPEGLIIPGWFIVTGGGGAMVFETITLPFHQKLLQKIAERERQVKNALSKLS